MKTINKEILKPAIPLSRTGSGLKITRSADAGGFTAFDRGKVVALSVPIETTAYARTVRLHELLHARNSATRPRKSKAYSECTRQAIEDCFVHLIYWPDSLSTAANRDATCTALMDARGLKACSEHNMRLLIAVRSLAIVGKTHLHVSRMQAIVERAMGEHTRKALQQVAQLVYRRKRKAASDLFESLLDHEQDNDKPKPHKGSDPNHRGKAKMQIIEPPRTQPCNLRAPVYTSANAGSKLRISRMPKVLAGESANGLFRRRLPSKGFRGSVLIDASGSMGACESNIRELCSLIPDATVAYYSGDHGRGELVIVAQNGKRIDLSKPMPRSLGGNEIDYQALQWLLRRQGPYTLVSDLQFCGNSNDTFAAHALLERTTIKVISSIDGAITEYGKRKQ